MKKLIASLATILCFVNGTALADSIKVTATVGTVNKAPVIKNMSPSYSPVVVKGYTIQSFSMNVEDADIVVGEKVSYTITPVTSQGSVDVRSGTLEDINRLNNGEALIVFKYLAPNNYVGQSKIIVTLNDGVNVTTKVIELYIY